MMNDWGMDWAWEGMMLGPLFMSGLLAIWVALIVALIRSLSTGRERPGVPLRTPREILEERLAKHELDREEYVERRKALDFSVSII